MTIHSWLAKTIKRLESASVPTARLDAEVLLADVLGKDRSWVLAHPDFTLQGPTLQKLNKQIERRVKHEPLAYIRGRQEFYGREFTVSPDTLTPRPETETMIEILLGEVRRLKSEVRSGKQEAGSAKIQERRKKIEDEIKEESSAHNFQLPTSDSTLHPTPYTLHPNHLTPTLHPLYTILDIGTGSGCIIITTALELAHNFQLPTSHFQLIGLDISKPALKIAKQNARKLGAEVDFRHFDLTKETLPQTPTPYTLITANLPYVPDDFQINLAATHEPSFAIYGGTDGLDYYRTLFSKLNPANSKLPTTNYTVLTESMPPQHDALKKIAQKNGYKLQKTQDFIQLFVQK